MTISRSEGVVTVRVGLWGVAIVVLLPLRPAGFVVHFLLLQFAQVIVQAFETLLPVAAIVFDPLVGLFQRARLQAAGTPLRLAAAGDEPGALQYLEVLGDSGEGHLEGRGELGNGGFTAGKAGQDGPARG